MQEMERLEAFPKRTCQGQPGWVAGCPGHVDKDTDMMSPGWMGMEAGPLSRISVRAPLPNELP